MPLKTQGMEEPVMNLTPMLDVVFNLIIFFMIGSHFSDEERQFDVHLPTVASAQPLSSLPDEIVINVYRDGRINYREKDVTLEELQAELIAARERYADQAVLIRGEGEGRYQRVVDVLVVCHRSEIRHFSLATALKEGN